MGSIDDDTPTASPAEDGAAAVELAFILPILVLFLFGIVQFAIVFNRQQAVHAAAREGARLASLPQTDQTEIDQRVTDALVGVPLGNVPTITVSPSSTRPCEGNTGDPVIVTVTLATTIDIPIWGTANRTLTGRGEFRCE